MFDYVFFNDTAATEIYTLSLHDALPILVAEADAPPALVDQLNAISARWRGKHPERGFTMSLSQDVRGAGADPGFLLCVDRKSTRLNSSHANISYAVFCLKKKNN